MTRLLARRLGVRITDLGIDSSLRNIQTGSGRDSASYYFLGIKRPGRDADHSPLCDARIENEWSYLPSWHGQGNLYLQLLNSHTEKNTASHDLVGSTSNAYSGGRVFEFTSTLGYPGQGLSCFCSTPPGNCNSLFNISSYNSTSRRLQHNERHS